MATKLQGIRDAILSGRESAALSIAARFRDLGDQAEIIRSARAAQISPEIYRGMGRDPEEMVRQGIQAIRQRYGI